ncbi:MAG TPA: hypothetical protein VK636_15950 [Gemmatimonadaceae bacterium]|nr:hypothetical protein [Gemmatimonadaceae bacterium]
MRHISGLLLFALPVLAACSGSNPADVRDEGTTFPVVANWTATSAPVAPATVNGTLVVKQRLGFHSDASFVVTGPPNTAFQWRIFKRDCSVNVAAVNNTAATGLIVFSTTQAYPDVTLDATGKATVTSEIAGWLDSLTPYSVRIRPTATTTFTGVSPAACGNLAYAPVH